MLTIYGIKNCDTMKKAFLWLESKKISYNFHDYKKEGITEEKLKGWLKKVELSNLINVKGTTWKGLTEEQKSTINDPSKAIKLLIEKPSAIKRPFIELNNQYLIGFNISEWEKTLSNI